MNRGSCPLQLIQTTGIRLISPLLIRKIGDVARRLGFHTGFLQEPQIPKPVDKAMMPGSKWRPISILQAIRVNAISVQVHFNVGDSDLEHRTIEVRPL